MCWWHILVISTTVFVAVVNSAVIVEETTKKKQEGLYRWPDPINILELENFASNVYGKNYAQVVEFYNSYCGHCRDFASTYRQVAQEIVPWKNAFQFAAIACDVEKNAQICRDFEVMAYPTLRYMHENYHSTSGHLGDRIEHSSMPEKFKENVIKKLQTENIEGRLRMVPSLNIFSYSTMAEALQGLPRDVYYAFFVLEGVNSTIGSEIILDTMQYRHILVKRVNNGSVFSLTSGVSSYPSIIAVSGSTATILNPLIPTKQNLLGAMISYLRSKDFQFPKNESYIPETTDKIPRPEDVVISDVVYYTDLEKTLRATLTTEITRYKSLTRESHAALMSYLQVLRDNFPYKGNDPLRNFLIELEYSLRSALSYSGSDIYRIVKSLEARHNPYKADGADYIGCKGSQPQYRGFTCGLWTLFHTLLGNAATKANGAGPIVLRAMHGYVKHFFGCTHCVDHFLAMSERNRLFDVKENDKAVLWLWIAHNEVNLRLAGDSTEDPLHPKIQFPSVAWCSECRTATGAWDLPAVYQYLLNIYSSNGIRDSAMLRANSAPGPLSNLDIGMLSFLYILSFIILILVIKYFLTKRFYRKRTYKHGRGKV